MAFEVDTSVTPDPEPLPTNPPTPALIEIASGDTHTHDQSHDVTNKSLSVNVDTGDSAKNAPPIVANADMGPSHLKKCKRKHKSQSKGSRSTKSSKRSKSRSERQLEKEAVARAEEKKTLSFSKR
ncbi:UNVERIFIED_CONTAM: hypothetical protein Slati_3065000 [Sesamum latifolium]|uniref:Uncharacterized protein n=1 Tax=Sesamum latifolium TaxID=2727402 RepID=A0AAW2UWH5_9LAMI